MLRCIKKSISKMSANQLPHVATLEENYSLYKSWGSMAEAAGTSVDRVNHL